jgi:hypothetical protein
MLANHVHLADRSTRGQQRPVDSHFVAKRQPIAVVRIQPFLL